MTKIDPVTQRPQLDESGKEITGKKEMLAGFKMVHAKKMDVRESIEDFKDKPNVRGYYRCKVLIR